MKITSSQSLQPWPCPKCNRQNAYFTAKCSCGYELKADHSTLESPVKNHNKSRAASIEEQLENDQPIEIRKQSILLRQFRKTHDIYVPEKYPNLRRVNGCGIKLLRYVDEKRYPVVIDFEGSQIQTTFIAGIKRAWYCYLFVPIIPLGFYVTQDMTDKVYFYGQISSKTAEKYS